MNLHTFIKKSKDYISCFVKYGAAVIVAPFAKNKEKYKDLWLIAERGIDARDNAILFVQVHYRKSSRNQYCLRNNERFR